MNALQKTKYWLKGWYSCVSWIPGAIAREWLPDFDIWNPPTDPDDYQWYAERVNGRAAMLAVVTILCIEGTTGRSALEVLLEMFTK